MLVQVPTVHTGRIKGGRKRVYVNKSGGRYKFERDSCTNADEFIVVPAIKSHLPAVPRLQTSVG